MPARPATAGRRVVEQGNQAVIQRVVLDRP
jgi:hypothetical protein